ncbi:unnamed protein product [Coregonus sp. 'balchen']|nr:unnamed protein product [Coregonus sp. 'balchen']
MPQCCDYYLAFTGSRCSSPESVTSDIEFSGFTLKELFDENRAYSPDSCMSESESVESVELGVISQRSLSPESITSEGDFTFLELLLSESRPSSPESIALFDEYRPLSPDSPVPHFMPHCCNYDLAFTGSRCSSPESVSSDIEFSGLYLKEFIAEDRADSPESIYSDNDFLDQLEAGLVPLLLESASPVSDPLPHSTQSETSVNKLISPVLVQSESVHRDTKPDILVSTTTMAKEGSVEDQTTLPVAVKKAFIQLDLSDEKFGSLLPVPVLMPVKQEPANALDEVDEDNLKHQDISEVKSLSPESVFSDSVSQFRAGHCNYYLLYSGRISPIPESVTTFDDHRPLSPDSPASQFRPGHCDYYLVYNVSSSVSPQSVTSDIEYHGLYRPGSPSDSELIVTVQSSVSVHRPLSPESITSEDDYSFLELLLSETRPSSPESVASFDDYRPLSPDSPVPHFMPQCCDYLAFTGSRCSSPESVSSGIEFSEFCLEELFAEERADSPESIISESEIVESVEGGLMKFRPLSPESITSEDDYTFLELLFAESRPSSPHSITSTDEYRSLSPDSPIPQFRPTIIELSMSFLSRSPSPISVTSDIEGSGFYLEELFNEERPDSPESFISESEFVESVEKGVMKLRPLSPESVTSEDDYSFLELLLSESRPSSPESVASFDEYRPLSPDSPVPDFRPHCCDYYLLFTEDRSSSPESVTSDIEFSGFSLKELLAENRAYSPDSCMSESESVESVELGVISQRSLSPESITSEDDYSFLELLLSESRPSSPESVASFDEYRTLSPDSPVPHFMPQCCDYYLAFTGSRCSSPESVTSDIEFSGFTLKELFDENRAYSPDSCMSESESVESVELGVISQRSLSPESITSEGDFTFLELLLSESRPSSPESIALFDEYRPLSPDSPVPHFMPHCCNYDLAFTGSRCSSPESVSSDIEFSGLYLKEFIAEDRADSPESIYSDNDFLDQLEAGLVPLLLESASPVSDPLPHSTQSETSVNKLISPVLVQSESVHRDTKPDILVSTTTMAKEGSVEDQTTLPVAVKKAFIQLDLSDEKFGSLLPVPVLMPVKQEPANALDEVDEDNLKHQDISEVKSLSPESVFSDSVSQFRAGHCNYYLLYSGRISPIPESVTTFDDHRPLSPDSPASQFRPGHCDYYLVYNVSSSVSPQSVTSDIEYHGLYRPGSQSDSELIVTVQSSVSEHRPLSPESITSEDDYSFLELLLSESRPSSPESVASFDEYRPLSPDSPVPHFMPQCCDYLAFTGSRCSSPESVSSDIEFSDFCLEELFAEERADSPESFISESEIVESVERGLMKFRPLSPESITSEDDYTFLELLLSESRPSSPHSITSTDEYRSLSPDSPIPQFRPTIIELSMSFLSRSPSPISVTSDIEGSGFYLEELFNEERPDSPESFISKSEFVESVEKGVMNIRPLSPESVTSEDDYSFLELLLSESRPSSPESVASFDEYRTLSPDSPVPHFMPHCCNYYLAFTGSRSSSPESVTSDVEFSGFSLEELFADYRADSPELIYSDNEFLDQLEAGLVPLLHESVSPVSDPLPHSTQSETSVNKLISPALVQSESVHRDTKPEILVSTTTMAKEGSVEDQTTLPVAVKKAFIQLDLSDEKFCSLLPVPVLMPVKQEPANSLDEVEEDNLKHQDISEVKPLSPESVFSDSVSQFRPGHCNYYLLYSGRISPIPESVTTFDDHRPLSPDSPASQFRPGHCDYYLVYNVSSSVSPQSVTSDIEYHGLYRPGSPSDSELIVTVQSSVSEHRPLSPESITSEDDYSFLELLLSESRPSSPESVASFDEYSPLSPDSPVPHFMPQCCDYLAFTGSRCSSPESVSSGIEFSEFCLEELFAEERADSPESIISESEIVESVEGGLMKFRPLSPESITSEDDYTFLELLFAESRPSSPHSITSTDEYRSLSPDSPIPQFRPTIIELSMSFLSRSPSPISVTSDIEGSGFYLEELFNEERPDSPESFISESEFVESVEKGVMKLRPLSPESITSEDDYTFLELLLSESRPSSPDSVASFDEYRPLSPDSPVPDFRPHCCDYYLLFTEDRSSSPQSVTSDIEFSGFSLKELFAENRAYSPDSCMSESESAESVELGVISQRSLSPESITSEADFTFLDLFFVESRSSSPESVTSFDEYRPLSPDSPVPDFRPQYCDYYLLFTADSSSSPESVSSDLEYSGSSLEELFTEDRPNSPISIWSEGGDHDDDDGSPPEEIPTVHWAIIQQFMVSKAVQTGLSTDTDEFSSLPEVRPASPEYRLVYKAVPIKRMSHMYDPAYEGETCYSKNGVSEHSEHRQKVRQALDCQRGLCGDFRPVHFSESNRGMPSVSETSAVEVTEQDISSLKHSNITDQTVTETFHEPHLPISQPVETEIRTPSPVLAEWEFVQLSSLPEYRPLSPESLGSDSDGILLYLDHFFTDMRPSSPESVASANEYWPLSPDSPVPHYGPRILDVITTAERRSSLYSVTSDIELFGLCLEESFAEDRADSPDSFNSEGEYEQVDETLTKSGPLSAESSKTEDEYAHSFIQYWLSELQPSSLDPMTSLDELQPSSAEPMTSLDELQPSSEEPMTSLDELDAAETSSSTEIEDSEAQPIDEFSEGKTLTPVPSKLMAQTFDPAYKGETFLNKSGVFECAGDRQVREIMERLKDKEIVLGRPITPESITSEEIQSFLNDWSTELELRPNSIESLDEDRPLSPDSPIPQFLHQCCDYYLELPGDRSQSPLSVTSDIEYCGSYLNELIPEHRPDSADSFLADSEFKESIEQFFMKLRALSPKSVTSEDDYTFLDLLFSESRPYSPESVTSLDEDRPLSPDSPIPQFLHQCCDYYLVFPGDRSQSPESVTSDIEYSELYLKELFGEDRPDSPDSFMSEGEFKTVEKGVMNYRSLSPESITSEDDHTFLELLFAESRPSSPESVTLFDEYRPLSPDSPIPQFLHQYCDYYLVFPADRSSSPESVTSDIEFSEFCLDELFAEDRADSPDSFNSEGEYEQVDETLTKSSPLSAESSKTEDEYAHSFIQYWLSELQPSSVDPMTSLDETTSPVLAEWEFIQLSYLPEYRPLSPESLGSDRDGILLYLDHFFTDMRPSSPESVASFDEYRPLSPDSPVPHFMPQCCDYYLAPTGDRSSSPQSVTSGIEFSEFCLEELFAEERADSPESLISEDGTRLVDESDKDMSQDPDSTSEESLSFLEDWFSELDLRPSSPESVASQEEYRPLSPDSPVPQYGPGLSVFTVSAGQRCSTPESVISDWDEFGLEDLLCETSAFSPDSIRSDTDTVLTQGDGQHYPPTDQVSTEHEPEMTVERARLKQPPELTWAPFRLVSPVVYQTHRAVEAFFCRASSPDSHREPVDDVETHRPHQASSQSSHMPSDEQNLGSPVAAVRAGGGGFTTKDLKQVVSQSKEKNTVMSPTLKGSEVQPEMEETSKHLKRKAMRKEEDGRVSAASVRPHAFSISRGMQ